MPVNFLSACPGCAEDPGGQPVALGVQTASVGVVGRNVRAEERHGFLRSESAVRL